MPACRPVIVKFLIAFRAVAAYFFAVVWVSFTDFDSPFFDSKKREKERLVFWLFSFYNFFLSNNTVFQGFG
jgi:hypothetical protein